MGSQINEFKEEIQFIQFENPLQNEFFLLYLGQNNVPCDFNRLYNDAEYSQALYDDYFEHLIHEHFRPNFPPIVNVEEYVNENEKNKKIKDMSKMNKGNGFIVYRKTLIKHLEILGVRIAMQQLSPLAGSLWKSEPGFVKDYYKELSEEIKKVHNNRVENHIKNNSSEDVYGKMSSKTIKDMTTKNGGNGFIIYRKQLNERLRSSGINLNMQDLSKAASYRWSKQSVEVKSYYKKLSCQSKKTLNDQLKKIFCKSDNDNNDSLDIKLDNNNGSTMSHIKPDNDAFTNDVNDVMSMIPAGWENGSSTNDFDYYLKSDMEQNQSKIFFF